MTNEAVMKQSIEYAYRSEAAQLVNRRSKRKSKKYTHNSEAARLQDNPLTRQTKEYSYPSEATLLANLVDNKARNTVMRGSMTREQTFYKTKQEIHSLE